MQTLEKTGFILPEDLDAQALAAQLQEHADVLLSPPSVNKSCYYDSFDWRLFLKQRQMVAVQDPAAPRICLQETGSAKLVSSAPFERQPDWPADLPPGRLRDEVMDALEMRILLPQVEIASQVQTIRILNEDTKTVARLLVEQPRCKDRRNNPEISLPARVYVQGIKGYDEERKSLERFLRKKLDLKSAPACIYRESLDATGRRPGDYSSKIKVHLSPEMNAETAARQIFLDLLDTLETNVQGTKDALDSEFLHDLRVATRRTRSALTQIKKVIPPETLEDYKERFAWLGQVTSPSRDMDVFLLELPHYHESLPPALGDALEPLHEYLAGEQKKAHSALRRKLNSPHFGKLLKDWRSYLEDTGHTETEGTGLLPETVSNASRPITTVSNERIWKMYRRVLKEGRAIDPDSPADDLHELRKSCKKLRYLIEFFASLYPGKETRPLIKFLKNLLDNLGNFQDLEVQAGKLSHFAEDMLAKGAVPVETLMAMGALVGDLLNRQQEAREEFSGRFQHFDCAENREAYQRLFKPSRELN